NTLFLQDLNLMVELGHITRGLDKFTLTWEEILKQYETRKAIFVDNLARGSFDIPVRELVSVSAGILSHWDGTLSYLLEDLEPVLRRGNTCVVMAGTAKSAKELEFSLESEDIKAHYFPVVPAEFPQNMVSVLASSVSTGFEYMSEKFTLFSYGKGLSSASRKVKKNFKVGGGLTSVEEIRKGDYVVHAIHGIGIFEGIVPLKTDNIVKDCIKIAYRGTDVLYVPVTQLDLVAKYVSAGETAKKIKLNKLGTDEWKKTKARVKSSVKEMAKQLTALYAARMNSKGFAFSQDIDMQADFERRFIYDETDDQLQSIREIKHDMEQAHPMDRLLCGDVGFGKTEVALRAAFKCIADGKQCVILVPTTILAFQHYQNIQKRFDGFPVEIEMISRFRTAAQKTKIKQGLKRGSIDLIVGTHSLIAKKVEFKDVGLLIIDEEQRFGVVQKEKLKEKFPDVDVLTLSATPIPRTLNMAMTGIRDMSVLETPPADRKPIQTYVLMHDLEILAEAMNREIRRGGQVYYLHNVVDTIDSTAYKIAELLPDARVAVAHGKMNEAQLSSVWKDLLEGEIDILVCTTIIETGVDVPNANTLIIENAQNLGLAQLHQIRGRIGRSTRRAFAYLTYAENKTVTEIAQKRLTAIREFTQFGAGFQIARKDLELRGGGNVLGSQQHGHLQEVGYDMYLQILSAAVEEEKTHVEVEDKKECLIDIAMTASIPEYYIDSVKNRMYMYKRIARIHTSEDAMDVMDEFTDRFGNPPKNVVGLVTISLLRNHAANLGIYEIRQVDDCLLIFMQEIKPEYIAKMSQHMRGRFMVSAAKSKPYLTVKLNKGDKIATIKEVVKILTLATREKTKQQNKISNS
ncbi:MAG: transcription-repair coupling factor, partial [Clostridia bacterium]